MTRIVLIEDDPTQRALTALVLRSRGWLVLEAASGEQGLRAVRRERPDAVVCDVLMPEMNGYQVLAAIRGDAQIAATPVIMLTGLVERGHTRLGMASGADDYLHKPYQPEELIEAIESVRRRSKARRDAGAHEVQAKWEQALQQERESLAATYERRLLRELNSRWAVETRSEAQILLPHATVIWCDLFRAFYDTQVDEDQLAAGMRKTFQAARDTLFLFGALEVMQQGENLVAVFRDDRSASSTAATRATRAALALHADASGLLPGEGRAALTVALHAGPLTLLRMLDALHGDTGALPVPGATLKLARELALRGRNQGWGVAATSAVTRQIDGLSSLPAVDSIFGSDGEVLDVHALAASAGTEHVEAAEGPADPNR